MSPVPPISTENAWMRELIDEVRNRPPLPGLADLQTGEVALSARTDPERHAAGRVAELEIVHDQARLRRAMDVQARLRAVHGDAVARPHPRLEIDIALVLLRRLRARHGEAEVRM